jgi:hypothetical protein
MLHQERNNTPPLIWAAVLGILSNVTSTLGEFRVMTKLAYPWPKKIKKATF